MSGSSNAEQQQSKITDQDRAVLDLKIARDKAQRYKRKVSSISGHATTACTLHGH